ncbi:MAG: hypothetical protein KDA72_07825, partial [Planctomycetales bacterium]|nr:hypothetical protein [Planctomycetales bacterium]
EPRIVAADLGLLEQVSGLPRREFEQSLGPAAETIAELKPLAYWRMEEMSGSTALDRSGAGRNAVYEAGVLFFLEGPTTENEPAALGAWTPFTTPGETNRCAHFAGGRMLAEMPELHGDYSVVLSFWNGMPLQAREVAGWMFSRDYDFSHTDGGVHLGLSGGTDQPGRLVLQAGNGEPHLGRTATPRWQWGRAVLVKLGNKMEVYQADAQRAEISIELNEKQAAAPAIAELFFGGRSDRVDNWEGKLDEIAVFDRGLSQAEVAQLLK